MKSSIILAAIALVALVGCQSTPSRTEQIIVIPPKYSDNIVIPRVEPMDIKHVTWKLMNRAEIQKFLDTQTGDVVLYTLDDGNVALLFGNIQEMKRYVQSQQAVVEYLLGVIDSRKDKTAPDTN